MRRPLVVVSPATEAVREAFAGQADFALQAEPRGTADALRAALEVLPGDAAEILVLSGDVPLVDAGLLVELAAARRETSAAMALVTVEPDDPASLGRIVRDGHGRISRVVEASDAAPDVLAIGEINAGLYAFDVAWLRGRIGDVAPSPVTGELYLPELVPLARADDRAVATLEVEDDGTLLGINDRLQLADAEVEMRLRINEAHMRAGVTLQDPASTFIDASVEIAPDVTIEPGVILRGGTVIERDAVIRSPAARSSTRASASAPSSGPASWRARWSTSDVTIGPFSHVRGGAHIGSSVQLGNYAEVKNSVIGAGTKSHHFSYLGDADVGERVNIGAGHHHGQLRRRAQAPHAHRRPCLHRLGHHPAGARQRRRGRSHRRRLARHARRAGRQDGARSAGAHPGAQAADRRPAQTTVPGSVTGLVAAPSTPDPGLAQAAEDAPDR